MEVKGEGNNAIVPVLACVLDQLCIRNDRLPFNSKNVTKFHALRPPAISIKDYLARIGKYAACSGECFVLALVYIDRIIQSNPTFVVNSLNIHRLLITSVMLAAKFFDDQYFNNAYYAKVGGVPCNEMNILEVEFLFMTNFSLFVTTDTYKQYYTELCNHARNTACGCSTTRVPGLYIPPEKFGPLTYRFEEEDEQSADFEDSSAGGAAEMITSSDSPLVGARRIPDGSETPTQSGNGGAPAGASQAARASSRATGSIQAAVVAAAGPTAMITSSPAISART